MNTAGGTPRLASTRGAAFAPRVICRFAFALFLAATLTVRAQNPTVITGDTTSFLVNGDSKIQHLRVTDGELLLTADEGVVSKDQRDITATGTVVLTFRALRLLADKLVYHRADGSFNAEHIRLGAFPYFVEGESASGTVKEITLTHASATYGEPSPWHPAMIADEIIYAPGQRLRTKNSHVGIGHMQPVPLPHLTQDLHDPLISYASLIGGFRRSLGAYAEVGLHLPAAGSLKLGGDVGIYTARGVMAGPSGNYSRGPEGDEMSGWFRTGFLNDHGDKKTDLLGRPVPENRGYVEWRHTQQLSPDLTLNAQVEWWKDSEVLRDFWPKTFFPIQQPDTFLESVYSSRNYFVSAFGRFQPNGFNTVQERLPELRFDLMPLAVGGGFYERFNASAVSLREVSPLGGPALGSNRLDAYYALSRPIAEGDWFSFTPVAGGRVTHYANISGTAQNGNYTRTLGEVGFDAALRTSGTFAYKDAQWKIDGLRHLLTPRLSYRYIPEADRGRGRIPAIDRQTFATYLQPLGLGDVRNIDDLRATNTLRLGLDNTLQTRDPVYGSRDLIVLNVATDFRFKRAPGEHDLSEFHAELGVSPARWLDASIYQSFTARSLTVREFNTAVTLHDGSAWSLRFANNFLRHQIEDFLVDGRFRLNERFDALTRLHYDARKHRFNEQAYGLVQNLDNTWRISYVVSLYSGPRRESHLGLNLQIEALGF